MRERRKQKADALTVVLEASAILGWIAILGVQIIGWLAAPEMSNSITRYHNIELRQQWHATWTEYLPILLGICAVLSAIALVVRPLRSRRRSDARHWNVFVLVSLTLIGIAFYWLQIAGNSA